MTLRYHTHLFPGAAAFAASLALLGASATAQIPDRLNYQGVLKRGDGTSPGEGYKNIQFRIYDAATGGNLLWGRTQGAHTDTNGLFNVVLMEGGAPIPGAQTTSLADVFAGSGGESRYLELTVLGSEPIMPRQRFVTAPYAFMAGNVKSAMDNFTVQGALTVIQGAQVKTLTVTENATVGGSLAVNSGAQIQGELQANGLVTLSQDLVVKKDAHIDGNQTVGGDSYAKGNLSVNGKLLVDGYYSSFGNSVAVRGRIFNDAPGHEQVWIQGSPEDAAPAGKTRNLALFGLDESDPGNPDHLFLNWDSEYTNGVTIGGPVSVTGNLMVQGDVLIMGAAENKFNNMNALKKGEEKSIKATVDGFMLVMCNGNCHVSIDDQDIGLLQGYLAHSCTVFPVAKNETFKISEVNGNDGDIIFWNWRPLTRK